MVIRSPDRQALAAQFDDHLAVALATRDLLVSAIAALATEASLRIERGGKVVFFGNGGSAADAQHLAAELTIRFTTNRRALPAIALTTDSSALTACGNDFGFEEIFARQVEALVRSDDIVVGISTSGASPNVLRGLITASALGAFTVGLTGQTGWPHIVTSSWPSPPSSRPASRRCTSCSATSFAQRSRRCSALARTRTDGSSWRRLPRSRRHTSSREELSIRPQRGRT